MFGTLADLVDIAGEGAGIEAANHCLDRPDRVRSHREATEADRDQHHRLNRIAGHFAAHAQWGIRCAALRDDMAKQGQHRRRQQIVAVGHARIAAVAGEQELRQVVGADRQEIDPLQQSRQLPQ